MIIRAKLKDICEISAGGTPSRGNAAFYNGGTIKWVKSGELSQGDIYNTEECITQLGLDNSSAKIFPANTVLIAMYGATVGSVGILRTEAATNQAVCGIQAPEALLPEFLYYFLMSKKEHLVRKAAGGGQPNISAGIIKNLVIYYPDNIDEQRVIVDHISKRLSAIDALAKKTEQQIKDVEAFIERRITELLIDKKKSDWTTGTINDFSSINPSVREMTNRPEDDCLVSFVPMTSVSAEEGIITDQIVRPYAEVKKGYTYFAEGDIIFAKITPCMQNGKIAVARGLNNGIGFGSTEFHVIRANERVIPEWLYYLFRRKSYLEIAATKMKGAVGQQRLPDTFIRETEVAFPRSVDEQKRITNMLNEEVNRCAKLIKDLRKQQENITALRECVFKEAFGNEE